MYVLTPFFLLSLIVPQDEVAEGVWRSNAQYRDDHHKTAVLPQRRTQDSHSVSFIYTHPELNNGNLWSHTWGVEMHKYCMFCMACVMMHSSKASGAVPMCDVGLDCSLYDLYDSGRLLTNVDQTYLFYCNNSTTNLHLFIFFPFFVFLCLYILRGHYASENQGSAESRQKLHLVSCVRKLDWWG